MASRKQQPKVTQQEVQESVLALVRIAMVWARRSFEVDEPRDRPADEALLRKLRDLVRVHKNIPLVAATGTTKAAVRASSLAELERYRTIHSSVVAAKKSRAPNAQKPQLAAAVAAAFEASGRPCSIDEARRFVKDLVLGDAPSVLTGQILENAGLKGYRSLAAVAREEERLREIILRREATHLELIEYFLACLQVPSEDLHGLAAALNDVRTGGQLEAHPRRWTQRSKLLQGRLHPSGRPYYVRYNNPLRGDPTRAELDADGLPDFGWDEDPVDRSRRILGRPRRTKPRAP